VLRRQTALADSFTLLITNDDGLQAEGLRALRDCLRPIGRVITVAPDREQSAASHAITLRQPLRIDPVRDDEYAVDGTPTDCVLVAMNGLLKVRPDIVVSGINHGPNMGDDVTYSGTVSAAFEGAILGLPAVSVSLATFGREREFSGATSAVPHIIRETLARGLPPKSLLNVNIPSLPADRIRGTRVTKLGHRIYEDILIERTDPRGRAYYWIGGKEPTWEPAAETDFLAVQEGYVSVTPISLDLTDYRMIETLRSWRFGIR
jgi:5'-nucleotidase